MRLLMALNLVGFTFGAAYCGFVWSSSHAPWLALIATLLFIISFALPVVIELMGLSIDFDAIENKILEKTRREHYRETGQEVLTNAPAPRIFKTSRPRRILILLMLAGAILMTYDLYSFSISRQTGDTERGVISNF